MESARGVELCGGDTLYTPAGQPMGNRWRTVKAVHHHFSGSRFTSLGFVSCLYNHLLPVNAHRSVTLAMVNFFFVPP